MGKKLQILIWGLLAGTLFTCIIVFTEYQKSVVPGGEAQEEKAYQVGILSCYESDSSIAALETLTEKYMEENPQVSVEIKNVRPGNFQKEICLEKDENNLSDIIIFDNVMTPALVSMDVLKDLSEDMTLQRRDLFLKTAYRSTVVNGKVYCIPFACDPYVVFYNKDYYEKHNISQPRTMEEFMVNLSGVRTQGNSSLAFAGREDEDVSGFFLQMIYLYGGTVLDLAGENSQEFFRNMAILRDMGQIPRDVVNWSQEDLMKSFSNGLVINAIGKLSSISLLENRNMKFSYGIMEIPYGKNQAYLMHGENVGMTGEDEEGQAAALLDYLTSEEAAGEFCRLTDKMSVYVGLENKPGEDRGLPEEFFRNQRYAGMEKRSYSSWFLISRAIGEQMTEFFSGTSVNGKAAADSMQNAVREAVMER